MGLTKRDIARAIHEADQQISISEAVSILDAIFASIKDRLADGEKVMISKFGTFQVRDRAPRHGVNPATGGGLIIERHRAVTFCPSPLMQGLLNETGAAQDVDLDPDWAR